MYSSKILLLVFIFLTVFFGFVNTGRFFRKDSVSFMNFVMLTIGVVGIIAYFI